MSGLIFVNGDVDGISDVVGGEIAGDLGEAETEMLWSLWRDERISKGGSLAWRIFAEGIGFLESVICYEVWGKWLEL